MASKQARFGFDTNAWLRDTRLLSLEARAVWIDLLMEMHRNDRRGYLSNRQGTPWTPEQIAAFCGCSAALASRVAQELIDSGVASCTPEGVLFCRRMVKEERKRALCSEAGKKGGGNPTFKGRCKGGVKGRCKGRVKGGVKGQTELFSGEGVAAGVSVNGSAESSPPSPPSSPSLSPPTPPSITPPLSPSPPTKSAHTATAGTNGTADPEPFDVFWAAYPRKTAKQDARRAWDRLCPDRGLLNALLASLERQKQSRQWREGIIPHPATWLNGRRWEDEMHTPVPNAGPVPESPAQRIARFREEAECRANGRHGPHTMPPSSGSARTQT